MLWSFFVYTMGSVCTVTRTAQCSKRGTKIFLIRSDFFYFGKTWYGKNYPFGNVKQSCHLQIDNSFTISSFDIVEEITSALCAETYTYSDIKRANLMAITIIVIYNCLTCNIEVLCYNSTIAIHCSEMASLSDGTSGQSKNL